MRMKTISLAAAFTFATTAVASACSWGSAHDAMAYTPVDTQQAVERIETASAPMDAWLVHHLEGRALS